MSQPLPKNASAARFERSTVDMAADRSILERSDLVLACAHVLHTNGQSTHETVQAAERLGTQLGLRATMIAHWEELKLRAADGTGSQVSFRARQSYWCEHSAMSVIGNCAAGRPPIGTALENIKAIAHAPLPLVAVCPCMILVPGPQVLNGAMDLIAARINLGSSRLVHASLVILAISVGLLLGMGIVSVSLPVGEPSRAVPLWLDVMAAGVAVAAFSVFFSTPLRMLGWPVAVGMLAHAVRWGALKAGTGVATSALVACLLAGGILAPVARRWRMPFAAIGFASVVSMMPGVFLFRMASGLVQLADYSNANFDLLRATVANAITAIGVILAMSFGVVAPKMIIDRFGGGSTPTRVVIC
jgi:uncharacterized membrane protein YjjB (DUF3815 family)